MKRLFLLILILPFVSWAQVDSLQTEEIIINTFKQYESKGCGETISKEDLERKPNDLIEKQLNPQHYTPQKVNVRICPPSLDARNGNPLYVIDGIPKNEFYSMEKLNPNEIASITVLKDATATALYGVNGRNGVIIIKTKKYQEELEHKETEYDLSVLDVGYESFLSMQPSSGTYSLNYLQNRNQRYVSIWNQRVLTGNPEIYEMAIDYDSQTFYGLEFEHKLYMFFKFMEKKHSISML